MDRRTNETDDDFNDRQDVRHGNQVALMILAEWVEKRDQEDPIAEHQFRLVRG